MELAEYHVFSRLRLTDFLPPDIEVFSSSGLECCSSHCAEYYEMAGNCIFVFAGESAKLMVEVNIDEPDPALPTGTGARILTAIGLPLKFGMNAEDVVKALGQPEYEGTPKYFTRYVVGVKWPYRVGCGISTERGLCNVRVVREDFFLDEG